MIDLKTLREQVSSYSILVVDDEEDVRNSIIRFASSFFKNVEGAENGIDALEKFNKKGHFDMVLTDLSMPKMNGVELIKNIRSLNQEVFVVVMSGAHEQYKNDMEKNAMVINKPFGFDNLTDLLVKLVESKSNG
ncbi:response regulator [Sulfurimonas sp.]|nr:response regulator [Sulfurimonas sp.]